MPTSKPPWNRSVWCWARVSEWENFNRKLNKHFTFVFVPFYCLRYLSEQHKWEQKKKWWWNKQAINFWCWELSTFHSETHFMLAFKLSENFPINVHPKRNMFWKVFVNFLIFFCKYFTNSNHYKIWIWQKTYFFIFYWIFSYFKD